VSIYRPFARRPLLPNYFVEYQSNFALQFDLCISVYASTRSTTHNPDPTSQKVASWSDRELRFCRLNFCISMFPMRIYISVFILVSVSGSAEF
jgi:hypothetical protein